MGSIELGPEAHPARRVAATISAGVEAARGAVDDSGASSTWRWEPGVSAESVLWAMWAATGLGAQWQATALGGGPGAARADRDLDAVVGLFDAAAKFVDRLPQAGPEEFLTHIGSQDIPGDTLVARSPVGESVTVTTPQAAAGRQWHLVVVAGVQEGVWPDLRLRGSLLGSEHLVDVVSGRATTFRAAQAAVRYDETRSFLVALTRASDRVIVTAVRSDDEQPSVYLDVVDPETIATQGDRPFAEVARTMTLPTLVGELRRQLVSDDSAVRATAVAALARLTHEGVPGADPGQWWVLREVSDDRPLRAGDQEVRVSPSKVESFGNCGLRWLLGSVGGDGPSVGAADIGTLVHDIAAELGDVDADTLVAEVDARWGRLGMPAGWVSDRKRHEAHRMVRRLATYFDEARAGGWVRLGAELDMRVVLGRAVLSGKVDRIEGTPDGTGAAGRRLQDRQQQAPRRGARPPPSAGGLPARGRDRGVRRAGRPVGRCGAAPGRQGSPGQDDPADPGSAARGRRPAVGRRPRDRHRRGDGWLVLPGDGRGLVQDVPGQGLLPRAARGEGALMARDRLSAKEIASSLGQPEPTAQQIEVIEAPMSPLLVVAGAGSGKTETMTGRVVWLVANGFVEPDQVLGLTFTRKAATELSERIGARLRLLQQRDVWHPRIDDAETGAEVLGGTPTVSTYHSYAGRLVREHALRLGYESESRLLSEAAAWQYASEVVAAYDGPMDDVQFAESTVTAAVVDLAGEMAEHLVGVGDVAAYLDRVLDTLAAVPPHTGARGKDLPGEVKKMREQLRARAGVLPMVERYIALKRSRDAMDFADQMALAARLAMTFDDIGAIERQRFGAVLLDEFQDTSAAQLELLRSLFVAPGEPSPVTAVGDPHQSIYGWRGASATTLSEFRRAFSTGADAGSGAPSRDELAQRRGGARGGQRGGRPAACRLQGAGRPAGGPCRRGGGPGGGGARRDRR